MNAISLLQVEPLVPAVARGFGFRVNELEEFDKVIWITPGNNYPAQTINDLMFNEGGHWDFRPSYSQNVYGWFKKCNNVKEVWKDLSVPEGAPPSFHKCDECKQRAWPTLKYGPARKCVMCCKSSGFLTQQEATDILKKRVTHKTHLQKGINALWRV